MKNKAFTLMELLIVLAIFVVLFTGIIFLINPISIINKGNDITRKKNLDDAKKMLEQYMNDTGCYPQPTLVCLEGNNSNNCHICTRKQSAQFSHFTQDICDPVTGRTNYLYQVETAFVYHVGNVVVPCPKWFKIFSVLDGPYNAIEDIWNCKKGGCGVSPQYGYSYLVTSPGAPTDQMATNNWYCYLSQYNRCIQCTPYENCTTPPNDCYGKELYPVRQNCCSANSLSPCN